MLKKGNDYDKVPSFTAKLCKADDEHQVEVVVKFLYSYTDTYGTAVHNYLYNHGLAPLLYSVENLHRGLIMVVMERLPLPKDGGGWVELDTFEGKLGERAGAVRKKLERIIDLLQEQRMVHVDLRPNNVMVKVDGSGEMVMDEHGPIFSLIDFDCAGKVGEVRYPPFLNPAVPWPAGAKGYLKVGEKHDRNFLNNWWDAFVKGVSC